jgi:hypothetical protein
LVEAVISWTGLQKHRKQKKKLPEGTISNEKLHRKEKKKTRVKRQPIGQEKIFVSKSSDRELIFEIYKELKKPTKNKQEKTTSQNKECTWPINI